MTYDNGTLSAAQKKALGRMIRDGLSEREQDVLLFGWERPTLVHRPITELGVDDGDPGLRQRLVDAITFDGRARPLAGRSG